MGGFLKWGLPPKSCIFEASTFADYLAASTMTLEAAAEQESLVEPLNPLQAVMLPESVGNGFNFGVFD